MHAIKSARTTATRCLAMCRNVERMLDIFVNMNLEMQKTGNLSASISKEELLKLVTHAKLLAHNRRTGIDLCTCQEFWSLK